MFCFVAAARATIMVRPEAGVVKKRGKLRNTIDITEDQREVL